MLKESEIKNYISLIRKSKSPGKQHKYIHITENPIDNTTGLHAIPFAKISKFNSLKHKDKINQSAWVGESIFAF